MVEKHLAISRIMINHLAISHAKIAMRVTAILVVLAEQTTANRFLIKQIAIAAATVLMTMTRHAKALAMRRSLNVNATQTTKKHLLAPTVRYASINIWQTAASGRAVA